CGPPQRPGGHRLAALEVAALVTVRHPTAVPETPARQHLSVDTEQVTRLVVLPPGESTSRSHCAGVESCASGVPLPPLMPFERRGHSVRPALPTGRAWAPGGRHQP